MKRLKIFSFIIIDVMIRFYMKLFFKKFTMRFIQSFYIWQKDSILLDELLSEFSDEDLLWSSFTDLLIDVTAERKFYWLLANDVSSS
jgi:hypothetical protein